MTLVTASIDIDAPREEICDLDARPARLHEWVTIHRRVNDADDGRAARGLRDGADAVPARRELQGEVDAHGVRRPDRAAWEGRGPAHSRPHRPTSCSTATAARASSTRTSSPPRAASSARPPRRVIVGGVPEREATQSLQQLKALLESLTAATSTHRVTAVPDGRRRRGRGRSNPPLNLFDAR